MTSSFVIVFFFNNKRSSLFNHGESFALRALHCTACLLTAERKWSFNLDRVLRVMIFLNFHLPVTPTLRSRRLMAWGQLNIAEKKYKVHL